MIICILVSRREKKTPWKIEDGTEWGDSSPTVGKGYRANKLTTRMELSLTDIYKTPNRRKELWSLPPKSPPGLLSYSLQFLRKLGWLESQTHPGTAEKHWPGSQGTLRLNFYLFYVENVVLIDNCTSFIAFLF